MNRSKAGSIKLFSTIIFVIAVLSLPLILLAAAETPEKVYMGIGNARQIINNINFNDVANLPATYWAKDAVYEIAALEAVKGYGDSNFRPSQTLSKEEAIALIYRMIGKEADAQKAAETLDASRASNAKKSDAVKMWADGYLQLAYNDGLIKQADFQTAMQRFQPKPGTNKRFVRADPAQRQEVAYWVAKALKLDPVYGQQNIFNSFKDWSKSEPTKIPYIEAILRNNIMNGKTGGYFDPLGSVQRDQMAKILKNMEPLVLKLRNYEKKSGYIEDIYNDSDQVQSGGTASKRFAIRGEDGKLYNILTQTSLTQSNAKGQEFVPGSKTAEEKELVVYKNGKLSTSQELEVNDQIDFIVNPENEVRYVNVRTSAAKSKYVKGVVDSVDALNNTISIKNDSGVTTYRVSKNAEIMNEGKPLKLGEAKNGQPVLLVVENDIVTRIDIGYQSPGQEKGDISGIVEDNNPELRYISLYEETGASSENLLRVYNYKPETVEVTRNGEAAVIKDVQPGDAVFLKRDENNEIVLINAVDNYENVYGRVISKQTSAIGIEYDDGTQQVLSLDAGAIIILDKKAGTLANIHEGDYVRMLLQKTPEMTKIKEITLQTYAQDITSIFKGELAGVDTLTQKIKLKHPEELTNGSFERSSEIGFMYFKIDDKIRIFNGENQVSPEDAGKLYIGNPVYIAVKNDFGDSKVAVMISIGNSLVSESLYDDSVVSVTVGTNTVKLDSSSDSIHFNDSTIVVKDERLTSGRSLAKNDEVYIVTNGNEDSSDEEAKIIYVSEKQEENTVKIFRGKIGSITANKNFTLASYSILDGMTWDYTNASKSFDISYNTRLYDTDGIGNVRDFVYSSDWKGTAVYVVADETEALLVSDASYGTFNAKGKIEAVSSDAGSITLADASLYNPDDEQWEESSGITVTLLSNTIIIKDNKIIKAEDIEVGDSVRILKKEKTTTGDAYLIMVE